MEKERSIKNKIRFLLIVPMILAVVLLAIVYMTMGFDSRETYIATGVILLYALVVTVAYLKLRPVLDANLVDYALEQGKIQKELLKNLAVPYAILDSAGRILWANKMFRDDICHGEKHLRKRMDYYFPELTSSVFSHVDDNSMEIYYDDKIYNAVIKRVDLSTVFNKEAEERRDDDVVIAFYLFDVTDLRFYMQENADQKLITGLLYIDNYDEVMDSTEEVKHSILNALVDRKINMYLANIDAITKRLENDKYFFVFRQKYLQTLKDDKFSLIDEIKNINVGNEIPVTLSMGIGAGTDSFADCYEYAKVAIGLALGRGGDQVAFKYGDKVTYYGGKSAGTEKTTRVKARVKAQAFEELLVNKDKVIIMAHQRPDADAFGSAVGIYRLVTTLGKKGYIVLNEVTSAIRPMVNSFKASDSYDDLLLSSQQAINMVDDNTMLVVCDVNRPSITECEELISLCKTVVVFDHHRQSNEAITNATLSYIEPFASSACEMITEMFQYISVKPRIKSVEADAMYAGILIDTDNFLNKTGVRTFEAASYLRKCGADIVRVRKMFRSGIDEMKERAQGISNAEVYLGVFALSYIEADPNSPEAPTVPVAKVANELLNVDGIRASFVVTESKGVLYVSARSIGDVNVQLVMERFNGGGHANIAGVQLKGQHKEDFFPELKKVLSEMYSEGDI
ncbi:MAG: DHH family phosphoesterase [Eubacterium sp.]|nr:DHH family phosphoesterase [Eubacterium sp.]